MIFGIIMTIIVGLSWIFYGWIMGLAPKKKMDVSLLICVFCAVACIINLILGFLFQPVALSKVFYLTFLSVFVSGFVNYFQLHFMSLAMQKGPNGIIWSMLQAGFVLPFFMGVIFFGVAFSLFRACGALSILIGLFLLTAGKDKGNFSGWKFYTLLAFLATGFNQIFSNLPSYFPDAEAVGSAWRSMGCNFGMMCGALLMMKKKGLMQLAAENMKRKDFWCCVLLAQVVVIAVEYLCLFRGMDSLARAGAGAIAYPVMVTSCILGFEVYTIAFLREKRTPVQICAIFLCLLGMIAICF